MSQRVYLITGCNRGIGKGLVEGLIKKTITYESNNKIIITARNNKAEETFSEIIKKNPEAEKFLDYYNLDVENLTDIRLVSNHIFNKYGYLSVLINNAGYLKKDFVAINKEERVNHLIKTFAVNFWGPVMLTESLLPMIKKAPSSTHPHILMVSSAIGKKTFTNPELNKKFKKIKNLGELEGLYNEYVHDHNTQLSEKWKYDEKLQKKYNDYGPSKSFLNSYMVLLSQKLLKDYILVNSYNPGWTRTDMGGPEAPQTIEEGCDTAMFLDDFTFSGDKTGKVYEERRIFKH